VSKDAVLAVAYDAAHGGVGVPVGRGFAALVWVSGLMTAGVTVAYCLRLWLRLFAGAPRSEHHGGEPAWTERGPLVLLAAGATVLGGLGLARHGAFVRYVGGASAPGLGLSVLQSVLVLALAAGALGLVSRVWRAAPAADPALPLLRSAGPALAAGLNMDVLYLSAFIRPVRDRLAPRVVAIDRRLVDGAVEGSGRVATGLAGALRRLENGNVQAYATGLAVGAVALAVGVAVGVGR
jgi:NADH-quinone oxidoreductase subunit L